MLTYSIEETLFLVEHNLDNSTLLARYASLNSTVLKIEKENNIFALKIYNGDTSRKKRSLRHELVAFSTFNGTTPLRVAKLFSYSEKFPSICYTWIHGETPTNLVSAKEYLEECILDLNVNFRTYSCDLMAVDAVENYSNLIRQIDFRNKKRKVEYRLPNNLFMKFDNSFEIIQSYRDKVSPLRIDTLSLSDYGLHNLIQDNFGCIYSIDFEFFGKDSTIKVLSDLITHPKSVFTSDDIFRLMSKMNYGENDLINLHQYLPAIALKWAHITLKHNINSKGIFDPDYVRFENPYNYLEYIDFILETPRLTFPCTYVEFKNMRE